MITGSMSASWLMPDAQPLLVGDIWRARRDATYRACPPPQILLQIQSLNLMSSPTKKTIAQIVYDNERHYLTPAQIREKIGKIWSVMDECIRTGVSPHEKVLPGRMQVQRRAPMLYKRLMRG